MLLYNGKKPGGYSIESYEPTDTLPEEEIHNNNFIKMAFIILKAKQKQPMK